MKSYETKDKKVQKRYVIHGGKPLYGEVRVGGCKNSALPILAAALLVDGVCRIGMLPEISDVDVMLDIMSRLGVTVTWINRETVELDCRHIDSTLVPAELAELNRASYYFLGALLGRCGMADVARSGGCRFGDEPRTMELHIMAFEALGAEVTGGTTVHAAAPNGLRGAEIYFNTVSVGATLNAMLAAVLGEGETILRNAAKEPHIVDVANFLNTRGAKVTGAGTDTIRIQGVGSLQSNPDIIYNIIPDQIEAGTYMAMVAATGGELRIANIIPKHMECITVKLREMGVEVEEGDDWLTVRRDPEKRARPIRFTAAPYPAFPTDMQPILATCLTLADGTSEVRDTVWNNRYAYMDELKLMGADVHPPLNGGLATIVGVEKLKGATVTAPDLRAGASLVVAGLAAEGVTTVEGVRYIERGYDRFVEKICSLGGDIRAEATEASEGKPRPDIRVV